MVGTSNFGSWVMATDNSWYTYIYIYVCVCVNHLNRCKTSTCCRFHFDFQWLSVFSQTREFLFHFSTIYNKQGNWALCDWPSSTKLGHRVGYLAWSARRTCIYFVWKWHPAKPRTGVTIQFDFMYGYRNLQFILGFWHLFFRSTVFGLSQNWD